MQSLPPRRVRAGPVHGDEEGGDVEGAQVTDEYYKLGVLVHHLPWVENLISFSVLFYYSS